MPGRRKPTAMLEASGAFRKDPSRRRDRENEPVPEGPVGGPPEDWVTRANAGESRYKTWVALWYEVVEMAQFGVLSNMDRMHVENIVYLQYKIRRALCGYQKESPADFDRVNKHLGQIGCIPSERSRVHGQTKTAEVAGEWADLVADQRKRSPVQ